MSANADISRYERRTGELASAEARKAGEQHVDVVFVIFFALYGASCVYRGKTGRSAVNCFPRGLFEMTQRSKTKERKKSYQQEDRHSRVEWKGKREGKEGKAETTKEK